MRRLLTGLGAGLPRRALLAALPAAACATRPVPPHAGSSAGPASETLHIVSRDWHTDIGLAVQDLRGGLAVLAASWPGARHLIFGFGERGYLLSRDRSLADMVMALLPGPGAMLVTGLSTDPDEAFGRAAAPSLRITPTGMARLQVYLQDSFEWEARGEPRRLRDGPYVGAVFYASAMTYSAGFTCNTWIAEALAQAGLPVRIAGVLFASQVMAQLPAASGT